MASHAATTSGAGGHHSHAASGSGSTAANIYVHLDTTFSLATKLTALAHIPFLPTIFDSLNTMVGIANTIRQDKQGCRELAERANRSCQTICAHVESRQQYVDDALRDALKGLSDSLATIEDDMVNIAGQSVLSRVLKRGSIHEQLSRIKEKLGSVVQDFIAATTVRMDMKLNRIQETQEAAYAMNVSAFASSSVARTQMDHIATTQAHHIMQSDTILSSTSQIAGTTSRIEAHTSQIANVQGNMFDIVLGLRHDYTAGMQQSDETDDGDYHVYRRGDIESLTEIRSYEIRRRRQPELSAVVKCIQAKINDRTRVVKQYSNPKTFRQSLDILLLLHKQWMNPRYVQLEGYSRRSSSHSFIVLKDYTLRPVVEQLDRMDPLKRYLEFLRAIPPVARAQIALSHEHSLMWDQNEETLMHNAAGEVVLGTLDDIRQPDEEERDFDWEGNQSEWSPHQKDGVFSEEHTFFCGPTHCSFQSERLSELESLARLIGFPDPLSDSSVAADDVIDRWTSAVSDYSDILPSTDRHWKSKKIGEFYVTSPIDPSDFIHIPLMTLVHLPLEIPKCKTQVRCKKYPECDNDDIQLPYCIALHELCQTQLKLPLIIRLLSELDNNDINKERAVELQRKCVRHFASHGVGAASAASVDLSELKICTDADQRLLIRVTGHECTRDDCELYLHFRALDENGNWPEPAAYLSFERTQRPGDYGENMTVGEIDDGKLLFKSTLPGVDAEFRQHCRWEYCKFGEGETAFFKHIHERFKRGREEPPRGIRKRRRSEASGSLTDATNSGVPTAFIEVIDEPPQATDFESTDVALSSLPQAEGSSPIEEIPALDRPERRMKIQGEWNADYREMKRRKLWGYRKADFE